jgi:aminomethyltransferase
VADVPGTVISRTGYSGELGFELFYPSEYGEHMWDSVLEAGAEFGIKPCGIAALRSLRIEKKYPSYGSDIDEDTTPIEAGLEWTVKLNGRDFVGERVLANQLRDGTSRKLVLLESPGRHKILPGAEILHSSEILSTVRSSGIGYTMGNTYALAYLPVQFAKEDQDLHIMTSDGGKLNAKVHFNAPYDPDLKRMKL